jgi:membrane associated rhomboid family serine protease
MTQRYFVYPLVVVVLPQLAPLLGRARRWYAAQITQLGLILLAALGAAVFEGDLAWVWIAWALFAGFVLGPRLLARVAWESQWPAAWRWAGRLAWGQLGRLFRRFARAEQLRQQGKLSDALALLDAATVEPMPAAVRGEAQLFRLRLLAGTNDAAGALDAYERVEDWGTASAAARARLFAARAYAATGDFERAVRCLQRAALSPRTLGQIGRQYRAAREEVLARASQSLPPQMVALAREGLRAAEEQSADWRALMEWTRPAPVTLTLLAVCAGTWLADKLVLDGNLLYWAGNIPVALHHGEWWRPTTALFLHANWLHLAMNGAALWMFGSAVERTMGRWRLAAVFLAAGTAANAWSAWVGHYDVSVGASGGIFGLIGAFGVGVYRLRSPMLATARRRLLTLLALLLSADLTVGGLEPQIDNLAHAGGFAAGLALAMLLWKRCVRAAHPVW